MFSSEDKEIFKAVQFLQEGKVILYPTDTIWGIGGDATMDAVGEKVISIKERAPEKGMIVLVDSIEMLSSYVQRIPEKALEIISKSEKPTTIIYPEATGIAEINKAPDSSIGIRVVKDGFVKKLITAFGKPISSSSANISSEPSPHNYDDISDSLISRVHYSIDASMAADSEATQPSAILLISPSDELIWIRS